MSSESAIAGTILETVGGTPLVGLRRIGQGLPGRIAVKMESFNPGGSVKDRIAITIVEDAERRGDLKPGGTIIEGTSGNTGMGLALVAAVKGYRSIFVMPDKMSDEKIRALRALGAEVVVTPTAVEPEDPRSYYSVAKRLVEETEGALYANQYHNPVNPETHYRTTGPELWEQVGPEIHTLVCGLGTGGTITGTGRYLKERNPEIRVVGADPVGSLYDEYSSSGPAGSARRAATRVEGDRGGLHPVHDRFRRGGRGDPGGRPGLLPDDPAARPRRGPLRGWLYGYGNGRGGGSGLPRPSGRAGRGARARFGRALPVQDLQRRLDAAERLPRVAARRRDGWRRAGREGRPGDRERSPDRGGPRGRGADAEARRLPSSRSGTRTASSGWSPRASSLLEGHFSGGGGAERSDQRLREDRQDRFPEAASPLEELGPDLRRRPDQPW